MAKYSFRSLFVRVLSGMLAASSAAVDGHGPDQIGRWQPEPGPGDADGRSNNGVFVNCDTVM